MLPISSKGDLWYSISSSNNEYVAIYHNPYAQEYSASNVFINIQSNYLRISSNTNYPWAERSPAQKHVVDYPQSNRWFNTTNDLWYFNTGFDTNLAVSPETLTEATIFLGKTLSGSVTNLTINVGVISNVNLVTSLQSSRLDSDVLTAGDSQWRDHLVAGYDTWTGVGTWGHTVTGAVYAIVYQRIGCYGFDGTWTLYARPYDSLMPTNELMSCACFSGSSNVLGMELKIPLAQIGLGIGAYEQQLLWTGGGPSAVMTQVYHETWIRGWE
jgi:hypothetical protein